MKMTRLTWGLKEITLEPVEVPKMRVYRMIQLGISRVQNLKAVPKPYKVKLGVVDA